MIDKNKMGGKKMNSKKILTFFLAMLMIITSLPFQVFANTNRSRTSYKLKLVSGEEYAIGKDDRRIEYKVIKDGSEDDSTIHEEPEDLNIDLRNVRNTGVGIKVKTFGDEIVVTCKGKGDDIYNITYPDKYTADVYITHMENMRDEYVGHIDCSNYSPILSNNPVEKRIRLS